MPNTRRRLSAILCADVVGYSKLMGADEDGTFRRLQALRGEIVEPAAKRNSGRLVKTTGDGFLLEFESAVNSVRCALDIQAVMSTWESGLDADGPMALRIGVNLGDVIHEAGDVYGDGVNVAARLESLAEPGTVYLSSAVFEQVRDRIELEHECLGEHTVKNIARPVTVYRVRPGPAYRIALPPASSPAAVAAPASARPERLSIVVLPFASASNDPDSGVLADSMTEDIITDLSRISGSFVISSSTTFTYRNRNIDPRQVASELNVRYVLTGTIRRASEQIRLTVTLVDGNTGAQIWADRYDRTLGDLFSFQDDITGRISRSLNLELKEAASRKALRGAPENLEAHDYALRAWTEIWNKPQSRSTNEAALEYAGKALALDPGNSEAWATIAYARARAYTFRWSPNPPEALQSALQAAEKAVVLDPRNADAFYVLAYALRLAGEQARVSEMNRVCLSLNPNHAPAQAQTGMLAVRNGSWSEAGACFDRALALSPRDPLRAVWLTWHATAELLSEALEKAIALSDRAIAANPDLPTSRIIRAVALTRSGQADAAQAELGRVRSEHPDMFSIDATLRWLLPSAGTGKHLVRDQFERYLRETGLPD